MRANRNRRQAGLCRVGVWAAVFSLIFQMALPSLASELPETPAETLFGGLMQICTPGGVQIVDANALDMDVTAPSMPESHSVQCSLCCLATSSYAVPPAPTAGVVVTLSVEGLSIPGHVGLPPRGRSLRDAEPRAPPVI